MILKRLLVFLYPLLFFLGIELLFYNINYIVLILIVLSILLLITLKLLIKDKFFSWDFWGFVAMSFLFFYVAVCFLFIISSDVFRHSLIIVFIFILGIYLESIFSFYYQSWQYQPNTFENFSSFLTLLIFFLAVTNLYAFNVFLNFPIWVLSLILVVICSLLIFLAYWTNKIKSKLKFIYLIIFNVIIIEFFWAIAFLPASFYINSAIITIVFFLLWELFKAKLNEKWQNKIIWRLGIISGILLLIIIISSRWS